MSPAANTLADATSPYLRQHADNPVHWQQWRQDALSEAASRDVPILLSIGYSACHWWRVLTSQGRCPMTFLLTADGRPFFCGTYYPKPAFTELLSAVTHTCRTRRDE